MTAASGDLLSTGLDEASVAERLARFGPNELPQAQRPSIIARLLRELREPMALLLLVAAGLSGALLGEVIDAVAIFAIVVLNATIALVQEGRATQALAALQALEAPEATVIRSGRRERIPAAGLVPGDIVVVQAGDRIPADLRLQDGHGIAADESLLTGESLPVAKHPGGEIDADHPVGDRDGMLHGGTLLTRGTGRGVVTATGARSELGAIAQQLHSIRREPTPLQEQLTHLIRRLGIAAVIVAGTTFALLAVASAEVDLGESFLTGVALAVAAVPEGLAAVTTVALALGVRRMARRGALVRRLPAVETLGATDVIVIDKTGTVTENRMRLATVLDTEGRRHEVDDVGADLRDLVMPVMLLCNDATLDPPTGDPTEMALLDLTDVDGLETLRTASPRRFLVPFDSARKWMATVNDLPDGLALLAKGAPEMLIPRCAHRRQPGEPDRALDDAARAHLTAVAERLAARGERVLALAVAALDDVPTDDADVEATPLTLVGILALRDAPRPSAASSVADVRAAGVRLLMATGDHPATATAIAAEIGLSEGRAMTGAQLRADGWPSDPTAVPVYARVAPEQKLELVSLLQEQGHTVAMTGDGVNDAPALKRADIGVALGASGSDVAREAADLVITDDDLATIVEAVREGRGIYDNLRKVIDYLVTSNLAEVSAVIGTLLLLPSFGVPLFPLQLLWINLLTDGLPALALGVDPAESGLMRRGPRAAEQRLLDLAHLRVLATGGLVLAAAGITGLWVSATVMEHAEEVSRTVLFTTLVLAQVLFAFVVSGPHGRHGHRAPNRWLNASAALAVTLQLCIIVWPPAAAVMDTAPLPADAWAVVAAAGVGAPLLLGLTRRLRTR